MVYFIGFRDLIIKDLLIFICANLIYILKSLSSDPNLLAFSYTFDVPSHSRLVCIFNVPDFFCIIYTHTCGEIVDLINSMRKNEWKSGWTEKLTTDSKTTFHLFSKKTSSEWRNTPTIPITHRPISLPTNTHNKPLYGKLTKLGIPIIQTTPQTIKNLTSISKCTNNITTSHAGIYSIPCKDCDKYYIGEIQRNLEKRIYEHKLSIKWRPKYLFLPHVRSQTDF